MRELKELEKRIGYHFQNPELLEKALRHSSYANEHKMNRIECNERLEFLGDAVLELVSSEHLFAQFPQMPEGELTRLRASLVCEPTLAFCAREIELGSFLRLGKGEEMTGGRHRDSVTSDALESVIGAVYLDGGFANAKEFVLKYVLNDMEHKKLFFDSKTILQEVIQGLGKEVDYEFIGEEGPEHNKQFVVAAVVDGLFNIKGTGHTKKSASQNAAYAALIELKNKGYDINSDKK